MGHIRLGRLPRVKKWLAVYGSLGGAAAGTATIEDVASATVDASLAHLSELKGDPHVNYCFWFLVRLVTAARNPTYREDLQNLRFDRVEFASTLDFAILLSRALSSGLRDRGAPTVFATLAELSMREAIVRHVEDRTNSLFGGGDAPVQAALRSMSTVKAFGEVAKDFFAKFMSRTIRFVADKELSNFVGDRSEWSSSAAVLGFHADLDRYCFETARLLEDFAGSWLSKHNWESKQHISEREARGFTAYAIEKIQMDLREARK